jgi:hypothetical protein
MSTRVESGDALPKGEILTVQPAELVGRNKSRHTFMIHNENRDVIVVGRIIDLQPETRLENDDKL